MNALIKVSGDWKGVFATFYIKSDIMTNGNRIDFDVIKQQGFDTVVEVKTGSSLSFSISKAPLSDDRTFVFVLIKDPKSDFDLSKVECNIPIEVIRSHSTWGWFVYGFRKITNQIKKVVKKN